jgi:hypothetical protein
VRKRDHFWQMITTVLALSALVPSVSAQAPPRGRPSLEARIISFGEQQYCKNQPDLFTVYVQTKLQFTNISSRPVVLARRIPPAVRERVSVSHEEADRNSFVYSPDPHEVSGHPLPTVKVGNKPDPARFVTISPGSVYETLVWAGLIADLDVSQEREHPGMTAGDFVMQIFVRTWPYTGLKRIDVEKIALRWRQYGDLFTTTIPTDFFPFTVPKDPVAPTCDGFKPPI